MRCRIAPSISVPPTATPNDGIEAVAAEYRDSLLPPDFDRLANLVATGAVPFPANLPRDQWARLAALVQEKRRGALIEFLARQIAWSIHADQGRDA